MGFVLRWLSLFASSSFLKALLQRAFIALGIGAITYTGMSVGMAAIAAQITSNLGAVSGFALQFLALAHIPQAVNVVWSAFVATLTLKGLTNAGKITRIYWDKENSVVLNGG